MDLDYANLCLVIYGDTKVLRQLLFNNRNNEEILDCISEMMIYTSMMEAVINAKDKEYLITMTSRILDNFDASLKCVELFKNLESKMRKLYEVELIANLTTLKDESIPEILRDTEMSNKYGVEVIDFSDKKYCLLYHTKSARETPEQLISGTATAKMNTICLSLASHRNQVVYGERRIIFATDEIPTGAFMRSSTFSMLSNVSVKPGSSVDQRAMQARYQRGALETSTAPYGGYSEVLCFRDGIKFKYIILQKVENQPLKK